MRRRRLGISAVTQVPVLICAVCMCLTGCGMLYGTEASPQTKESADTTSSDEIQNTKILSLEELEAGTGGTGSTFDGRSNVVDGAGNAADGENELIGDVSTEADSELPPKYAYERLSEAEQLWYRDMERALEDMQDNQPLSDAGLEAGLTENDIDRIFQCVLNDHPEYFYVEGYTYTRFTRLDKTVKLEFSGTYAIDDEGAVRQRAGQIEEAAENILAGISAEASDYDKVKYVYEVLVCNTEYDLNAPDNQNIYSVLVNRRSVCQGYAKATQYLLNRLGVECTLVTGMVDTGEGHAWNLVKVDGEYYHVDTTWGDASYTTEGDEGQSLLYLPEINYDYLCVNTEQLLRTHTLDNVVPVPVCTSLEDNYFVREGVYFTAVEEEALKEVFARYRESGKTDITLKCADSTVYEGLYRILIEEQGIFDYLDNTDSIAYAQNEKQLSMTFWMTSGDK